MLGADTEKKFSVVIEAINEIVAKWRASTKA